MKLGKSAYLVWFQHSSTGFNSGAYAGNHSNSNQSGRSSSKYAAAERCELGDPNHNHFAAIVMVQLPEQLNHLAGVRVLQQELEIER